eukprot:1180326-Prorocentrum_minimum.AAC.4
MCFTGINWKTLAQHDVAIRHRQRAPPAVRGRPRVGPRTLRAHLRQTRPHTPVSGPAHPQRQTRAPAHTRQWTRTPAASDPCTRTHPSVDPHTRSDRPAHPHTPIGRPFYP